MHNKILNILRLAIVCALILTGMILGSGCHECYPETFSQEPTAEPTTPAAPTEAAEPTETDPPTEPTTPETEPAEDAETPTEPEAEPPTEQPTDPQPRYPLTDYERSIVEAVVAAEARGEDFDGQCLIAQCILNTAEARGIRPNAVVLERGQYAAPQYKYGYLVSDAVSAVFDHGYQVTTEPIRYFYAFRYCTSTWHENKLEFVLEHGGHRFFKE